MLLVLAGVVFALFRGGDGTVIRPPTPPESSQDEGVTSKEDAAGELLTELVAALDDGTRREVVALAAPGSPSARRAAGTLFANVRALDVRNLALRYVDEDGSALSAAEQRDLGPRAWVADVEMTWKVAGFDRGLSEMDVSLTFVPTPDGVRLGSTAGDHGNPAPLWLLGRVAVAKSPRTLVMTTDPSRLDHYARLARRAVAAVAQVLPRWREELVVEVPRSQEELNRVLDAEPGAYSSIAAVTSTVDGSLSPSSPAHILVNPEVFAKLGQEGAQIVMSHEAAHVATDAAVSTMPLWLLEGFGDYVALAHAGLPVELTASQILEQVREQGPPRALPGPEEFDPSNRILGASYESAWLAARLVAEKYGEARLIEFYRRVDDGMPIDRAFEQVLGTDEPTFTREWQDYLRDLAQ